MSALLGASTSLASAAESPAREFIPLPDIKGRVNRSGGRVDGSRFFESAREIPVDSESDVIVCGGGPAGIAAAIASARAGAKTTLFEIHGCLGGVWTAGLLGLILDSKNKGGIMSELLGVMKERGGRDTVSSRLTYNPEIMKLVLEELCVNAGVRIQYFTRVVAASVNGRMLEAVMTESKAGRQAWTAKTFIDCTGDGDLAAQAGCSFDLGRDASCGCQPMSLMALITGADPSAVSKEILGVGPGNSPKELLFNRLKSQGVHPSYVKPTLLHLNGDLYALMANHEYGVSAFDPGQVTKATIEARAEINRIVNALKSSGGGWENVGLVATAEQIGIREGRRIRGLAQITAADVAAGKKHRNPAAQVTFPVDIHAMTEDEGKTKGYSGEGNKSRPYDIPMGALIAKDVDGLMMAGRCISGDFVAHASYRVTGNAVAMGESAGKGAALAAKLNVLPHELPS